MLTKYSWCGFIGFLNTILYIIQNRGETYGLCCEKRPGHNRHRQYVYIIIYILQLLYIHILYNYILLFLDFVDK